MTIISPSTANTMFINGIFLENGQFVDKYKNILKNTWVVLCYWTNQNSMHGDKIANVKTEQFCKQHNLDNKKY